MPLTHLDVRLLEFEESNPRHTGLKADLILHRLGMSTVRYYQQLHRLARLPEVRDRYPRTAARLERAFQRRQDARAAGHGLHPRRSSR